MTGKSITDKSTKALQILTWNIGYAGMGEDSDFLFDHGKQLRPPPSRESVADNLKKIEEYLNGSEADIMMLQEVPYASWITYSTDVMGFFVQQFDDYQWTYTDDLRTKLIPPPFSIRMGNATASTIPIDMCTSHPLEDEPDFLLQVFRKEYRMHVIHLEHDNVLWSLINIHLSAFDDKSVSIREKQLSQVFDFALSERKAGYHVVVGGDWNMKIVESDFGPYSTRDEDLFWVRPLPDFSRTQENLRWVADPSTSTVRTAEQPYQKGENYTLIIDAFVISDNVEMLDIKTDDLSFTPSDHHPVRIEVKAKDY
ncbi:MAG: endonuclease/exonuclease/phosphatase family protein [Sphaerochaetaceae bacterium]|nr:endonuclease/exonuclease/phosphatase family protein [Sphaerochaetaceae bacterium]